MHITIIYPDAGCYTDCLQISSLDSLCNRCRAACMKLFDDNDNSDQKLFSLLPPRYTPHYNLRQSRDFVYPQVKTKRFSTMSSVNQGITKVRACLHGDRIILSNRQDDPPRRASFLFTLAM